MALMFEKYAADYAEYRPAYPEDMIESLVKRFHISDRTRILDLACGTGKFGESLTKQVKPVITGVDKSLVLLGYNQYSDKLNCVSESLPFADSAFDIVTIGQAFHWFDFELAFAEISRVLKPGGGLIIAWYRRARASGGYRKKMDELVKSLNPGYEPEFMDYDWQSIIAKQGRFEDIDYFKTKVVLKLTVDDYIKLQRSKSYVGDSMSGKDIDIWTEKALEIVHDEFPDGIVSEDLQYFYVSASRIKDQ